MTDSPDLERGLLAQVSKIDKAERAKLAMVVLGPRPSANVPLAPVLASILLLHNAAPTLRRAGREILKEFFRAIAESDAIREHQRENRAIRYDIPTKQAS